MMSVDVDKNHPLARESSDQQSAWDRVYSAVTTRWPEVDQLELLECEQSVDEITAFVDSRVDAESDEVRAVVTEFAPAKSCTASAVPEIACDVVERLHYQIDEAPVKSSLTGVLIGFSLGVIATTIYSSACRKAEMQRRGWFS